MSARVDSSPAGNTEVPKTLFPARRGMQLDEIDELAAGVRFVIEATERLQARLGGVPLDGLAHGPQLAVTLRHAWAYAKTAESLVQLVRRDHLAESRPGLREVGNRGR